jgi:hypothetical protein
MANQNLWPAEASRKSDDLRGLKSKVDMAKKALDLQLSLVDAAQAKVDQYGGFLTQAGNNKSSALTNLNLAQDAVLSADALARNVKHADERTAAAVKKVTRLSAEMATLVGKLIFSVEVINKLTTVDIGKQKLNVPLLPALLLNTLAKTTDDANKAVALTLVALESCYSAESTLLNSQAVVGLARTQAERLRHSMDGGEPGDAIAAAPHGLLALMRQAYEDAESQYDTALRNSRTVNEQLATAQSMKMRAAMDLASLQAGLASATAAAYAA